MSRPRTSRSRGAALRGRTSMPSALRGQFLTLVLPVLWVAGTATAAPGGEMALCVPSGSDWFAGWNEVSIEFEAPADGFVVVAVVDAGGILHVSNPTSHSGGVAVRAAEIVRMHAAELTGSGAGARGVSWAFALFSPEPLRSAGDRRNEAVAYRVTGDPFHAFREFYEMLRPTGVAADQFRIGAVRFYVGEWSRYPAYLCTDGHRVHAARLCASCRIAQHRYEILSGIPERAAGAFGEAPRGYLHRLAAGEALGLVGEPGGPPAFGRSPANSHRVVSTSATSRQIHRGAKFRGSNDNGTRGGGTRTPVESASGMGQKNTVYEVEQ